MARYYHSGRKAEDVKEAGGVIYGGLERGNDPDRPSVVKVPTMFGGREIDLKPGGVAFGLVGHGFWHVSPGEYVDLPDNVLPRTVKNLAPQLMTKDEAVKAGLCYEDGSPRRPELDAKLESKPKSEPESRPVRR